jgi:hypothetical protein
LIEFNQGGVILVKTEETLQPVHLDQGGS